MTRRHSRLVCAGCRASPAPREPYPFRCPNAGTGDVDHVLRRELDLNAERFPAGDEANPFLRYRRLLHFSHLGVDDSEVGELVHELDERAAAVDGQGFATTPFERSDMLSDRLGFSREGGVWVKDETGNVSGSHKARHLFNVLVHLELAERRGLTSSSRRPDLAIASCGNAALAAAVVAAAGGRRLQVFVPADADPFVLERLGDLGARVTVCPRDGRPGDPTYRRLLQALAAGALPFSCQGNLNGLAVEGGYTLGYELAAAGVPLDRLVVQVGGGALASACLQGLTEAVALGALPRVPRLDTVQTAGVCPLKRAYDAVVSHGGDVGFAIHHRSLFMRPWASEPHSVAHGILDDETYDWAAVIEGMLRTRGSAVTASESTLIQANALAHEATGIDVDPTGSAGLAGLSTLIADGAVGADERVAVLFTGVVRTRDPQRRKGDEKLSRSRHPVAT